MKRPISIGALAGLLGLVIALPVAAQRGSGGIPNFTGSPGFMTRMPGQGAFRPGSGRHFVRPRFRHRGGFYRRSAYVGYASLPYYYPLDYYERSYTTEPLPAGAPAPPVVIVRTTEPTAEAPPPPPAEPLMLELRGDHWVRITDSGESEVEGGSVGKGSGRNSRPRSVSSDREMQVRKVPAAVLVFRDGHQELTEKYTIIGPDIYTSADYWVGGSWTKKIPLAELDVPATLQLNRERGVRFNLPSAPNEVVVRP